MKGGDATWSAEVQSKTALSDTAPNVQPAGAVEEILVEARRNALIEEQIREQPIFTTGEVLLIRGGFFKVKAVTEKRLYLDFQGEAGQLMKQQ